MNVPSSAAVHLRVKAPRTQPDTPPPLDVRRRSAAAFADQEREHNGDGCAEEADVLEDVVGTGALAPTRREVLVRLLDAREAPGLMVVLVATTIEDFVVEALRARTWVRGGAA